MQRKKNHNAMEEKMWQKKETNLNENAENREFVVIKIESPTLTIIGSDIRTIITKWKANFQLRQCAPFAQIDRMLSSIACYLSMNI